MFTVVSWRQLERQAVRDKERSSENALMLERHYKQELGKVEAKARALEKERNMLMVSVTIAPFFTKIM